MQLSIGAVIWKIILVDDCTYKNCGLKKKQLRNMYKNILIVCNAITLNNDSNIRIILVAIFRFQCFNSESVVVLGKIAHTEPLYIPINKIVSRSLSQPENRILLLETLTFSFIVCTHC